MLYRRLLVASLALTVVFALSAARAGQTVHKTPQDVFNAAKKAIEKEDMKAFCACLTPEARDGLAGLTAFSGILFKAFAAFGKEDAKDAVKEIEAVLNRHGLTEDVIKKMEKGPKLDAKDPKQLLEGLKKLIEPVKDRDTFLAEMLTAMKKIDKKGKNKLIGSDAQLKDLEITEDKAKGFTVSTQDGKEKRDPIEFRRVGGGWRIDLPFDRLLASPKKN